MTFTCAMTIVVISVIHHQWQHVHFKEYVYENMLQLEKLIYGIVGKSLQNLKRMKY